MSITVVIPSRGRPQRAREAVQAIRDTAVRVDTSVILAVDADDPCLSEYRALRWSAPHGPEVSLVVLEPGETGDLVRATNTVSLRVANADPSAIIGNLGDDHLARTPGWDRLVLDALAEPGIAYGRDGIQDEHLPTAPFISASIVLALGWFALPSCHHLYIDDCWRELGTALGRLRYLPDVLIEHMHPAVHKGAWDEGYERANNAAMVERDRAAYNEWHALYMKVDVRNVRHALRAAA